MYENVVSELVEDVRAVSHAVGVAPLLVESGEHCWIWRPRLWWLSWSLIPCDHFEIHEGGDCLKVTLLGNPGALSRQLAPHSVWPRGLEDSTARLPTCVRHLPRAKPPRMPAGLDLCNEAAIERWKSDDFAMPPYQYDEANCVVRSSGLIQPPCADEREVLIGFELGHTVPCSTSSQAKHNKAETESLRKSLVGKSWQAETAAWLLNHLALHPQYSSRMYTIEELRSGVPNQVATTPFVELPGGQVLSLDEQLVMKYLQGVDHRGSDVRLDSGALFGPTCWPRCSLKVENWVWHEMLSYPWKYVARINELEARGALQSLRWRLRRLKGIGRRYLHILDSIVSLAVLSKKRSSSHQLNRVVKRYDALELASSASGAFGFARSEKNPADRSSRRCHRR